jgi:UDP-N-acetyl-D-glucosamine dehydrogenase
VTACCGKLAEDLYLQIVETVVPVSCPRVAEAAKLLENTFRSVNIALANEMALICRSLDIDVWEVIDAAATKPFGFMPHYPGPGTGGHCIPLDPQYLAWKARLNGYESRFISLATEINRAMPGQVVADVVQALKENDLGIRGSRILIVGVAYKPDVSDCRESPGMEIIRLLQCCGAQMSYSDPRVASLCGEDIPLRHVALDIPALRTSDCVVIVTNHSGVNYEEIARESSLVVDTRNACRAFADQGNIRFL